MTVVHTLTQMNPPAEGSCVALGMFDGLHLGHQGVIGAAVEKADREGLLPVVFTFSILHERPAAKPAAGRLLSPDRRETLLEEMGVRLVLCPPFEEFRELTAKEYVERILKEKLRARHVFCGDNYRFGRGASCDAGRLRELCGEAGIEAHVLNMLDIDGGVDSSTRIRACIAQGDMPGAARLTGRLFAVDFEVIHGRHLGRTLGLPTINQELPDWFAAPRFGVYASLTTVDGQRRASVTNVGYKPTVGSDRLLAETFIQEYQGDLYGRRVLVEFLRFLRPEKKFSSIEELRSQILEDSRRAAEIGRREIAPDQEPTGTIPHSFKA